MDVQTISSIVTKLGRGLADGHLGSDKGQVLSA